MEWTDLTTIISLLSALGAAVLFILNIRQKKLQERQKTRQEKNLADEGEFENLKKRVEFAESAVNQQVYLGQERDRKIAGMQRYINKQENQKDFAEFHICKKIECQEREPELGTYTTEDFDPKKLEQ